LNSSLWTLLGSAGQGNYTASSTFLDSLAAHRRIAGLPATVINWCAWSGGGLATISGARGKAMLSSLGMKFVSPDHAMQMFDDLMHRDVNQIAVAVVDWAIYAGKMGKSSFLAELLNRSEDSRTSKLGQGKTVLNRPHIAANGQARQGLLGRLQQHITAKLGFAEAIDPDQPLNEIGLDSLMSVSLSNSLEDEFGIPVPIAELISGPTINQLVDTVFGELVGTFSTERNDPPRTTAHAAQNTTEGEAVIRTAAANEQSAVWTEPVETPRLPLRPPAQFKEHLGIAGGQPADGVGTKNLSSVAEVTNERTLRTAGKWLIAPRPRPTAKARLFCFPYAGGGLVSFRAWAPLLDESVEIVAVEPPGRGTRINETPIDNMDTFVECLLPEMLESLDRPSAFFGHCLGGLTMFATLCALPKGRAQVIKHLFACGVRPPHLLKRRGEFEDNLVYDMMLHKDFDIRVPPYGQVDEIFADIIRHFDTPAADKMLRIPKLREALLPTIRAEFGMAYNYEHQRVQPFSFPISSFVGDLDPWVSEEDSAAWGKLTCGRFTNHVRKGSHFLMAEDREYILATINDEFVKLANE
jgi:surfactin synthase thioesterase subunit/acyl carrier protein